MRRLSFQFARPIPPWLTADPLAGLPLDHFPDVGYS